jgi:hypothetical protein
MYSEVHSLWSIIYVATGTVRHMQLVYDSMCLCKSDHEKVRDLHSYTNKQTHIQGRSAVIFKCYNIL